jgi:hypothetical protein
MLHLSLMITILISFIFFSWHLSVYKKLLRSMRDSEMDITEYEISPNEFPYPSSIVNVNSILASSSIVLNADQKQLAMRAKYTFTYHLLSGISFVGLILVAIFLVQ